ncbi:hypothetical protein STEG23_027807, partial [Scotinomys teguina]
MKNHYIRDKTAEPEPKAKPNRKERNNISVSTNPVFQSKGTREGVPAYPGNVKKNKEKKRKEKEDQRDEVTLLEHASLHTLELQ